MIGGVFWIRVVSLLLCAALVAEAAADDSDGPKGGHPLNRGPKRPTLEDLLDAPDWQAGPATPSGAKPPAAAVPAPSNAATPGEPGAAGGMRELITKRHQVVDKGQVFRRLDAINRDRKELNDQDIENFLAWSACYQEMRALVRPDRGDRNARAVLDALERDIGRRKDFYEGRVLAALGHVYQGDAAKATEHLRKACDGLRKHQLFWTIFAQDCCHVLLLLNRPDDVKPFVDALRKLPKQSAVRCWLVATYEVLLGHDGEADRFFDRALNLAGISEAEQAPAGMDPLLGDAALFLLTASLESKRDADQARTILAKASAESRDWRILRARAALEAHDGNWDAAIRLLDDVSGIAPPAAAGEITSQRAAYAANATWTRPRPGKQ